ncbi:endopeptidase La [Streptacidiphilus sp. ASG 303]|uniref:endopeptidase La n=1 Tax=Streptacidiphilus sp. ASG 303 TaxID=2896847 RepID=UPI001E38A0D0|nr:endopeptidase La [Streptacidiphilus sp. ASG 303]MCD0482907.1 endopeptidase La [Streptacidiphilus sp. ASG 303]
MASTPSPLTLPVLPLDDEVVLPGTAVPLDLSGPEVRAAVDAARAAARGAEERAHAPGIRTPGSRKPQVLLVPRIDGVYAATGTLATVEQVGRLAGGDPAALVRGVRRMRIGAGTTGPGAALWVEAVPVDESPAGEPPGGGSPAADGAPGRTAELVRAYRAASARWLGKRGAWQAVDRIERTEDPSELADSIGYASFPTAAQKLRLLETGDPVERLAYALELLEAHLAEEEVNDTIRKDVQEGVERQQKEFLLRRQLEAVRKELAELDGGTAPEEDDYRARVEAADLPEKVREAALKEVGRLERSSDASPEGGWIRTWLDTVLELPWNERTEDAYDIPGARAVLDADHAGLDDVKDRIVEYLAVRRRRAARGPAPAGPSGGAAGRRTGGAVLALVGPPGVGKTSLGESVARAMGRRFVRVALGGVRDEAEIRGHRRTYVGALPGRIVRAIREAGSMNPVVLLDEVDKVGADYRGDPAAALLEVLDPAQNHTFRDHYLEVELDLSDVVFLATANVLEAVPEPLLDRMELVRLDGYTEDEKVAIARDHLLPRQLEKAGLGADEVRVEEAALRRLAGEYTREAGVRNLERALARVLRKVAARHELGGLALPAEVTADGLRDLLGRPHHTPESAIEPAGRRTAVPGVATGLAVTGAGGDVLHVEASLADPETGATGLSLTGQLGDVMKESAHIALSFLRSHGAELELPVTDLRDRGVHLHVPAGAVPKDGPSAGVTMTTALASLLSGRRVRADVAMTGEVSLTGRVLPVGGIKQKVLAADRAGLTTVVVPQRNGPDLDDVPEEVLRRLTVHRVSDVREVLELALEPAAAAEPAVPAVPAAA